MNGILPVIVLNSFQLLSLTIKRFTSTLIVSLKKHRDNSTNRQTSSCAESCIQFCATVQGLRGTRVDICSEPAPEAQTTDVWHQGIFQFRFFFSFLTFLFTCGELNWQLGGYLAIVIYQQYLYYTQRHYAENIHQRITGHACQFETMILYRCETHRTADHSIRNHLRQ